MTETVTPSTPQQVVGVGGLVVGAWAVLAPGLLHRTYGTGVIDAPTVLMSRMWGTTLAALGAVALATAEDDRRETFLVLAAMNGVNAALALSARGVPTRARVGVAISSATFAGVAAAVAHGA